MAEKFAWAYDDGGKCEGEDGSEAETKEYVFVSLWFGQSVIDALQVWHLKLRVSSEEALSPQKAVRSHTR